MEDQPWRLAISAITTPKEGTVKASPNGSGNGSGNGAGVITTKPDTGRRISAPSKSDLWRFLVPIAVGLAIWMIPNPSGVTPQAWSLLAIFVGTIAALICKPMPMGAIAMIGMTVLAFAGTLGGWQVKDLAGELKPFTIENVLLGFANKAIWLIVLAVFIARGFIKSGLGERIAYLFVSKLGKTSLGLSYGLLATDFMLAPVMPSNTARAGGVIMPILRSISSNYGSDPADGTEGKLGSFLTLTAFQVNVITSAMFLTAMSPNLMIQALAGKSGVNITWGGWALAAIVPGLVSLAVMPLVMYKLFPPKIKHTPLATEDAKKRLKSMGPLARSEKIMLAVFGGLLLLWTLGDLFEIDATTAALAGLTVLLLTKVLNWKDIQNEKSAWDILIWFSVLVMMAGYLDKFGLVTWFSDGMGSMVSGFDWMIALIILSLVYFYSHYLFASSMAHVSAMYAAFLVTAIGFGAPPMLAALVFAFESSLFGSMTQYGFGPAAALFAPGYVPMGKWWKAGFIASVINIAIWMGIGGLWFKVLGIW